MTRFRVRRTSSKIWQWCLVGESDEVIIPWVGAFRSAEGKAKCLAAIDLVRRTNARTPVEFNVLPH